MKIPVRFIGTYLDNFIIEFGGTYDLNNHNTDMSQPNYLQYSIDEIANQSVQYDYIIIRGHEPFLHILQLNELINKLKRTNRKIIVYTQFQRNQLITMNSPIINNILNEIDELIITNDIE